MGVEELTRRAERWVARRRARVAGHNPWAVVVAVVRDSVEDRVTGLAAEMAFFTLLSLVPLVVALGASLGSLEALVGRESVNAGQAAVLRALGAVFSTDVTREVLRPLIQGLLNETRGGVALSSVLAALWLASRVFTVTIRALDLAYDVEERRGLVMQRVLALAFALGAVVAASVTLLFAVVGPLLGTGRQVAGRLGLGEAFTAAWAIGRWPFLVCVLVGFFATVYRFGPNVRNTWAECLPGALLGVVLWLVSSLGLRTYLATVGSPAGQFEAGAEAAAVLGVVGAVLAAMLWVFVSSLAVLVGGELNSILVRQAPGGVHELDAAEARG